MKNLIYVVCLLMALPKLVLAVWLQDGGSLNADASEDARQPNLTFFSHYNGEPYVIWSERNASSGHYLPYMKNLDSGNWVPNGGNLNVNSFTDAYSPCLALSNTYIFSAWAENGNGMLYEKRWNGTSWTQDGGEISGGAINGYGSISTDGISPYIAYQVYKVGQAYIRLMKWNSTTWVQESTDVRIAYDTQYPCLNCSTGTPYLAWVEGAGGGFLYVAYSNGTGWTQIGGEITGGTWIANHPSLAMDGSTLYLAYAAWANGLQQICVSFFNGGSWSQLGSGLNNNSVSPVGCPSLVLWNGTPYVAWQEYNGTNNVIYVKHWNGSSWVQDGTYLNTDPTHDAQNPCLVINNGVPYVAFCESNGTNGQIYLKHLYLDGISNVDTNYGVSGKTITTTITGTAFNGPATATLKRMGNPDIVSTSAVQKSSNVFAFTFNLSGAAPNTYDVQVAGASQYTSTLKQSFTILKSINSAVWSVTNIGVAGGLTATGYACGLDIGDGDQDNAQELYIANQDTALYQMKKASYGWSPANPLAAVPGVQQNQVLLADGDADHNWEVYSTALDTNIYQFKGATLVKSDVGSGPVGAVKALALAKADVLHSGVVQLYVGGDSGSVCQFTNTGTGWCARGNLPSCPSSQCNALTSGDGNNDNGMELYSANADEKIYQYSFNGINWSVTPVFSGTSNVNQVAVGDGDNDGNREVYAACQDGKVYQIRWSGSSWTPQAIGQPGSDAMYAVAVSDADNDGANEVYAASGDGHVYMYKKIAGEWTTPSLGNAGVPLFAMSIGDADNDHQLEIYALGKNNHVYQFKASEAPTPTPTATPFITPTATQTPIRSFGGDVMSPDWVYAAPNPIRGHEGKIYFNLAMPAEVELKIYTPFNQLVLSRHWDSLPAGQNLWVWQIGNIANGVYILRIKARNSEGKSTLVIKKIFLIK